MINLTVVIDNDEAIKKLEELRAVAKDSTSKVVKESEKMDSMFNKLKGTIAGLATVATLKELVDNVVNVRGEVQKLEVAFETMLGSKQKSDKLMAEITSLAATTPFGLQDVSNATKQLLAFGSTAENISDEIKMLGNIASGLSIPLNDMIYLYGTTRTQGQMFTQDLRQFMGRGIPLAEELAKQFGVTKNEVANLVSEGKVGFEDMATALQAMTSEGGKFNNLMEKQSQTIAGQISNLEDAIFQMFNEIGRSSEGVISGALDVASSLVENYEAIGKVLLSLINYYGAYKTALIISNAVATVSTALTNGQTLAQYAHAKALAVVAIAQEKLNLKMMKNPYVLAAMALATVVTWLIFASDETEKLAEAEQEYADAKQQVIEKEDEHRRKMEELISVASDESKSTEERRKALVSLEMQYPDIFAKYDTEYDKLANIKKIKEEIAEFDAKNSITNPEVELADIERQIQEYLRNTPHGVNNGIIYFDHATKRDEHYAGYNALLKKKREAQNRVAAKQREKFVEDASSYSQQMVDSTLQEVLKEIELRNNITNPTYGANSALFGASFREYIQPRTFGHFSDDDLQALLQTLNRRNNDLKAKSYTASELKSMAEAEYDKALKALADFDASEQKGDRLQLEEKRKQLVKAVEEAEKKAKDIGVDTSKKAAPEPKGGSSADREVQRRLEKAHQIMMTLSQENIDAEIEQMEDGSKKKIAQIDNEWLQRKQAITKNADELRVLQSGIITEEQQREIDRAYELNDEKRLKSLSDMYREEFSMMQDYLKEYGTFHQRRLAIAAEYDKKIAESQSLTEKKSLEKEKSSALASLNASELSSSINWEVVFGDFGEMFHESLRPQFEALSEYLKTDEFAQADAADKKTIIEAYENLKSIFGDSGSKSSFRTLGDSISRLNTAQTELARKQDQYTKAYDELIKAQEDYTAALKSGNEEAIQAASMRLGVAQIAESTSSQVLIDAQNDLVTAQDGATNSAKTLKEALTGVAEGLSQLASNNISTLIPTLQSTALSFSKIEGKFGDVMGKIAQSLSGTTAGIISFVLQIIDILKDGLSNLVAPILDAILSAVSNIIGDLLNFKDGFFRIIGETLYKGILGIFKNILTLGGWFDWWGSGESDEKLADDIERLTEVNKALQGAMDRLSTTISDASKLYDAQKTLLSANIKNTEEMMKRSLQASSNGFLGIGGSRSSATMISNGMSEDDWRRISAAIGKTVGSGWDFSELNGEELLIIYETLPDLWGKIMNLADEGHQDASQYLQDLVDLQLELMDIEKQYKENLTGMSLSSFRDEFKNILLDMEVSAEDFADNFNKMLVNSIASSLIASKYQERIDALYNDWASAMQDKTITDAERKDLERQRDELYNEIADDRKVVQDMLGYDSAGQSASSKGFQAMSQDTGDELNGRFTDIQGKTTAINEAVQYIKSLSVSQLQQTTSISETLAQIHNDTSLIEKHTRELSLIREGIDRMNRNIENI